MCLRARARARERAKQAQRNQGCPDRTRGRGRDERSGKKGCEREGGGRGEEKRKDNTRAVQLTRKQKGTSRAANCTHTRARTRGRDKVIRRRYCSTCISPRKPLCSPRSRPFPDYIVNNYREIRVTAECAPQLYAAC